MKEKFVLAQLGCGYWGPNLLRNFSALANSRVKYVVDASAERRLFVEKNFPQTKALETHQPVLDDPEIDAVVIATPAATHFELARAALQAGKHVFVEKPMATKAAEVDELSRVAQEKKLVAMVGHTFIYNSAVRYVKKLIDAGDLGDDLVEHPLVADRRERTLNALFECERLRARFDRGGVGVDQVGCGQPSHARVFPDRRAVCLRAAWRLDQLPVPW